MYTQALNTAEADDRSLEDAAKAAQFLAASMPRSASKPNDWMPAAYRKQPADPPDLPARSFRNRRHAA